MALLPLLAFAGPYADLDARQSKLSDAQIVAALRRLQDADPRGVDEAVADAPTARATVGLKAALEDAPPATFPKVGRPPGNERLESSWLARALDRLRMPERSTPRRSLTPGLGAGGGGWAATLVWIVLAVLLLLALVMLARNVRLPKGRRKAMVGPEEPLRSADAWLEEANRQIARGEYREAVRGLYVAGLMRLDEAGVARFDRHQTNWEHLRRIEASPKTPAGLRVREDTGRFDRVWYGRIPAAEADALAMRDGYDALVRALSERKE